MYAGIEAGGTKFVVALGTGPDDLEVADRIPTTTPDETLPAVIDTIRGAGTPEAIGIAAFGPVDLDPDSATYGHITSTPKPSWGGTDLVGTIRDAFEVPVGFDTDVNGAALGESRWGALVDVSSGVYVTVGTGIGGGALVDGQPVHGLIHPEMGHLLVRRHPDDDYAGRCPYHGDCLEGMASGPAVEERWGRPGEDLGDLHDRAVAVEAHYLAQLAVAVSYVLSPHRLVFGGGILHLDGLIERLRADTVDLLAGYLASDAITEATDRYVVRPGLGDHAGVLGAIALAERAAD